MKRFGIILVLAALAGCDNMQHQRGAGDVTVHENVAPAGPRLPPAHTVVRGSIPPGNSAVTGFRNGQPLEKIPKTITRELLLRGQDRFNIYCAVCHGADGYGRGIVVRRGFPAPPSYHDERLRTVADGHLYDVITRGFGVMLPFSDRLTPDDRWAVVAYLRALQRSQRVAWQDLSPVDRARFEKP